MRRVLLAALFCSILLTGKTFADPCGMVPPIYNGDDIPITRIGEQQTYVCFRDGVETIVIRPGFSGNVDEFGMLIPFPSPPALRKVSDNIFPHIAAAIDPPEVVIDLRIRRFAATAAPRSAVEEDGAVADLEILDRVRVIKQEAVGMYEVTVLEAGSAKALKRWMDDHQYQYPTGMDDVCEDYVQDGWCFVAVKTKVGQKSDADPKPGQRIATPKLPQGSSFDGHVQAMGFRFKTDELVVPMRLSAFNKGDLRNIVYLLTDGPRRVRGIPEEFVVRQIKGAELYNHVTQPLPLRIIGGTVENLGDYERRNLPKRRDPTPKNGAAKELFASDMLAIMSGELSLPQEEQEKELLRIGEHFGLRGSEVDALNAEALEQQRKQTVNSGLQHLKQMTLTVVDGDFPREVISRANLKFVAYSIPAGRNSASAYDAKLKGPQPKSQRQGVGQLDRGRPASTIIRYGSVASLGLVGVGLLCFRRGKFPLILALLAVLMCVPQLRAERASPDLDLSAEDQALVDALDHSKTASSAIDKIVKRARANDTGRTAAIKLLLTVAKYHDSVSSRGWAIAALAKINGQDVDEHLISLHSDEQQSLLVRTWAAAARVTITQTPAGLMEKAQLISQFPSLGRPIGMRLVEQINADGAEVSVEKMLATTVKVPQLQKALMPAILAHGAAPLADVLVISKDQGVRRQAAAFLGSLAAQGDEDVASSVVNVFQFAPDAQVPSWDGGPLFIPGIPWTKEDAKELVGNLVAWHLWCDRNGRPDEQKQIHNNLRSLGLASAAGYESPGFREANTVRWLEVWGKAVGKSELQKLLAAQGADKMPKYRSVLDKI